MWAIWRTKSIYFIPSLGTHEIWDGKSLGKPEGMSIEEEMHQDNRNRVSVMEAMNAMELPGFDWWTCVSNYKDSQSMWICPGLFDESQLDSTFSRSLSPDLIAENQNNRHLSILMFVSSLTKRRGGENVEGDRTAFSLCQAWEKPFKVTQPVILMTRGDMVTGKAFF